MREYKADWTEGVVVGLGLTPAQIATLLNNREKEVERLRGELALAEQAIDTARFLGKRKMDRDTDGHEDDPEAFNCVLHIAAYDESKESEATDEQA